MHRTSEPIVGCSTLPSDIEGTVGCLIAHWRYATTGSQDIAVVQPFVGESSNPVLAHNGQFLLPREHGRSDTEIVFRKIQANPDLVKNKNAISGMLGLLDGSFSLVCYVNGRLIAARDAHVRLSIRREVVDRARRGLSGPGPLIADIGPDPPLFHALAQPLVAARAIQHPDRRVVRVQQITGHDLGLDQLNQRGQRAHRAAAPIHQRCVGDIRTHAPEDLVLAIERDVIVELGRQDIGREAGASHGSRDRTAGGRLLYDRLAAAVGFLDPGDLDNLQLCCDHVDQLADVLA